jgi:hypothetical protein
LQSQFDNLIDFCIAEKVVATATPLAHELEEYKLSWSLSTGDTLIISRQMGDPEWERHLEFTLATSGPGAGLVSPQNHPLPKLA